MATCSIAVKKFYVLTLNETEAQDLRKMIGRIEGYGPMRITTKTIFDALCACDVPASAEGRVVVDMKVE